MRARVKACLWCKAVFVGTREDFCQRSCGEAWRCVEGEAAARRKAEAFRKMRAAGRAYWKARKQERAA